MSRIGKNPVFFGDKVQISVTPQNEVIVKSGAQTLAVPVDLSIEPVVEGKSVVFKRKSNEPRARSFHGLYRALVQNAVTGVTTGWTKELELNGVGYRAAVSGKFLDLSLGFSHPIKFPIPDGLEVKVEKQTRISIKGSDKGLVGEVAAKIRSLRPPEPFLGKGVKYSDEVIRRKAGKSSGKK